MIDLCTLKKCTHYNQDLQVTPIKVNTQKLDQNAKAIELNILKVPAKFQRPLWVEY